jgi:hypothetical protein
MKQEFVTLYGKAIIERDILHIRSTEMPFSKTVLAQLLMPLLFVGVFIMQFFREEGPKRNLGIVLWGILMLIRLPEIFNMLVRRSYALRIPLQRIKSIKIDEEEPLGLNVSITIHLRNGRYRKLVFRKLEQQYEPFIETITQYITQPQPA